MKATTDTYIIELITKLISKTDNNEVKWASTSRSNQFILKMNSAALVIEKNRYMKSPELPLISFKILNEIGDEIERIEQSKSAVDYVKEQVSINALSMNNNKISDIPQSVTINQLLENLYQKVEQNVTSPVNDFLKKTLNELDTFSNSK